MSEKPIKVDAATDRIVSELAYFLRITKKAVVAIAVADYSEQRDRYLRSEESAGEDGRSADPRPTMLDLAPLERLALRRKELIRVFAAHRAGDLRLAELDAEDRGSADLVLLAETDLLEGGKAAYDLSRVASRLLGLRVEVLSTTMMRTFDERAHRRALDLSRPL
jgi:hypothetical protein